jgi:hypothetical protein
MAAGLAWASRVDLLDMLPDADRKSLLEGARRIVRPPGHVTE